MRNLGFHERVINSCMLVQGCHGLQALERYKAFFFYPCLFHNTELCFHDPKVSIKQSPSQESKDVSNH
jgi:hypothetical protein